MHPHSDERFPPAELGASIFVGANKNMIKAAQVGYSSSSSRPCVQQSGGTDLIALRTRATGTRLCGFRPGDLGRSSGLLYCSYPR